MPTTVKKVPGFEVVATGNNIQTHASRYYVYNIQPYPNSDLIVGNTYNISDGVVDPNNRGIVVELVGAPGAAKRMAIFQRQT